jgi:LemA protein
MAVVSTLLGAALLGGLIYGAVVYLRLRGLKAAAGNAWAAVDQLLRQRYDEVPKLVKVCEGYMKFERESFESVNAVRIKFLQAGTPASMAAADGEITRALNTLFAVAENYPALKTNENFMQHQGRVRYLDIQMADRAELYNSAAADYNENIRRFPVSLIAGAVGYSPVEHFRDG